MAATSSWSTQQLTEFLAAVGALSNEGELQQRGLERIAQAVEAELGLLTVHGRQQASVGLGAGMLAPERLDLVPAHGGVIEMPPLGPSYCWTAGLEKDIDGSFTLIRAGTEPFSSEERGLLRGMARILSLQLRSVWLVDAERAARQESERQAADIRERQRLLEALIVLQRMITDRAPLQEILDAVATNVGLLTGDGIVVLRLAEPDKPGWLRIVASIGLDADALQLLRLSQIGEGAGGRAVGEHRLVVMEDYSKRPSAIAGIAAQGVEAAMAAPVREEGLICGSLMVGSSVPGRTYTQREQEMLLAFAEHASLALTDAARTREMVYSALHDTLTGLPNRALFLDRLDQRLLRARREPDPSAALLFVDLDQLKRVNDSLGHLAGDNLLRTVAQRLRVAVRPADLVARLAGDEFIVLLDEVADLRGAADVADRLIVAMSEAIEVEGRFVTVTGSVGIRMVGSAQDSALEAMRDADLAMYEAKGLGGGRWSVYRSELQERAQRRFALEGELRTAVGRNALQLAYQPVIDLATGEIVAAEALVRWRHATRGWIPPDAFIPMAEQTGLIVPVGELVLGMAVRDAVEWDLDTERPLQLNVNLSVRQLKDPGFTPNLARILANAGMPPERLTLEITESVLVEQINGLSHPLMELRDLGVRLAMDDFGTGYSSLSYLQRLPIDSVKIDRSFVSHVAEGPRSAAFVRAIVEMCRTLELTTVAEGVETEEQARVLRELGCDLGQGYHFSRPRSEAGFRALLEAARDGSAGVVHPPATSPARRCIAAARPRRRHAGGTAAPAKLAPVTIVSLPRSTRTAGRLL